MGEYRLSESAKNDLMAIAQYGDEHFGVPQSNRYRDQLKQRFSVLAEQPQLYPAVDHIRPGYHRSVCGAHSIYYRIEAQGVEIVLATRTCGTFACLSRASLCNVGQLKQRTPAIRYCLASIVRQQVRHSSKLLRTGFNVRSETMDAGLQLCASNQPWKAISLAAGGKLTVVETPVPR